MKLNSSNFCNCNIIFVEQHNLGCKIIPIQKWEQLTDLLCQINLGQDSNLRSEVKINFLYSATTNKKEQMPPQRLITLTSGIQIHGQPIKNKKYKIFKKI
jgi:hypothetical protein